MSYNNVVALNKKARKPHKKIGGVLATKVAKLEKAVRKAKPETKYAVTIFSDYIENTYALGAVFLVPQGVGDGNRVADDIFVKNIKVSMDIRKLSSPTDTAGFICWVLDKYNNDGGVPVYADIMETYLHNSILRHETKSRYQVLKMIRWTDNADKNMLLKEFVIPVNKQIHFDGTAATDCRKNQVYILMGGNRPVASAPYTDIINRIYYTDV